ncbi:lytic murein transglycosylase [Stutzerimonas kunmingensis]|jgi:membrane-bound lytic murein transglycosylase B|uniref:lytic murein transglycosylase n=1 Tax=Stutzerimonas kunmingensis TaxID=1211807 RepID=UPI00085556EF|nr:lytic murein transglycosylase [Stutzerimonas kunmingensis]OCX98742.1 MAG: murein transglycosylase [Pseudomonas sp. K35]RRU98489.1 lytic murein transglycosylase [Stutzerimonas xanthomarina]HBC02180.1 lytic murein transglycosylase [Pseudomonas sp.]|tara:strand:- start:7088 stop:8383 length:1296 start_codon:yes stop_codon:yes gene_type:complete
MYHTFVPVLLLRTLVAASAMSLVVACAAEPLAQSTLVSNVPAASQPSDATIADVRSEATHLSFSQWREQFRAEALAAGISAATFDQAFAGVQPDPAVIEADRSQPEFTRPVWQYLEGAISPQRVRSGRRLLSEHATTLDQIEARYGVDRETLVAVWGLESSFGQIMGDKSVIRSLATLAHEGRRPAFAKSQLIAALEILQHGDVAPQRMRGSWAGAMGQTQFIPTTYNTHAVDFDGDGKRDIWNSSADALASAAHYLQASGWKQGKAWGFEVELPEGFDYALADTEIRKPLAEWRSLGLRNLPGDQEEASASLLLPAGHRGPAFLIMDNFRAILRYNNSSAYALAIGLLAENFQGKGEVAGSWPRGEQPLSRSERLELQERLVAQGFDPGTPDGIIGANTRKAIRGFQQRLGWPADGHPTQELLGRLRAHN